MAAVVCKFCSQSITVEKATGTVFCPNCKKAFWAGGEPPRETTRIVREAPRESIGFLPLAFAGIGLLCFGGAGLVFKITKDNRLAATAEKCEALKRQFAQTVVNHTDESARLVSLEKEIAQEETRAEALKKSEKDITVLPAQPVRTQVPATPLPAAQAANVTKMLAEKMKSVVVIRTNEGVGSGFIVSPNGIVVTNRHVAGAFGTVEVQMQRRDSTDKIVVKGQVIALDTDEDLSLIKLPAAPESVAVNGVYPVMSIRSTPVQTNDKVIAIGSPGLEAINRIVVLDYTVTRGGVTQPLTMLGKRKMIETSATVNPGNSGGPLIDELGNVVGVVTLKDMRVESIAYALPATTLCDFLQRHTIAFEKKKVP